MPLWLKSIMKKQIAIGLATGLLVSCLSGCSILELVSTFNTNDISESTTEHLDTETESQKEKTTEVQSDEQVDLLESVKHLQFQFDGDLFTADTTYADLESYGWYVPEPRDGDVSSTEELEPYGMTVPTCNIYFQKEDQFTDFSVAFANKTDSTLAIEDCTVSGYMIGREASPDFLWEGLTWGASYEDVMANFGDANFQKEKYSSETTDIYTWENEWDKETRNTYSVTLFFDVSSDEGEPSELSGIAFQTYFDEIIHRQ